MDARFVLTRWDAAAERLYGWAAGDVLGRDARGVVSFGIAGPGEDPWAGPMARTGHVRADVETTRKDGRSIHVEVTTVALCDGRPEPIGYVSVHRDVTGTVQRRHALPAGMVEDAAPLVALCDLDGRMLFVDEAGQRLVGLGRHQIPHTDVLDYVAFEDRAFLCDRLMPMIAPEGRRRDEGSGDVAVRLRHFRTGALIPVLCEAFRVDDPHTGDPCGFAAVARPITGTRRAGEPRGAAAGGIRDAVLESTSDAFYGLDLDWRFTYLDERAAQLLSELKGEPRTREDLVGKDIWDELPDAARRRDYELFQRSARDQVPLTMQYRLPADGPWWDVHLQPSDQGLSVYFRDVTDRKRDELARGTQHALVAELGLRAVTTGDLQGLMDEAADAVSGALGVQLVAVAEILPDGGELAIRAGAGWHDGVVGHAREGTGDASQSGYTLTSRAPVVARDLRTERRFRPGALVREHGAVSAITVMIEGPEAPFGVLGALATHARSFSDDDVHVLQSVANVLAGAVQRTLADQRLQDVREAERRRMARELHDGALRDLTQALALAILARPGNGARASGDAVAELLPTLRRVGEQLRGAIYDLRLGRDRDRPFGELLAELVEVHRGMADGPDLELELRDGVPTGPLFAGPEVVRLLGEALTNARRHSGAAHVRVRISGSPGTLHMSIADDGRGFDVDRPHSATARQGITGMRERAELLGGRLEIRSAPGRGTEVRFDIALDAAAWRAVA